MKNRWIFGNVTKDFLYLWAIGFAIILLLPLLGNASSIALIGLIVYVFIDSGHVYVTSLRTYFDSSEAKSRVYIYTPLALFLLVFFWTFFGLPYFWSFVVYATFYHNTRQHYGVLAWHSQLNEVHLTANKLFLYLLTVTPFIGFHFRNHPLESIYSGKEFFFYPSQILFLGVVAINLFVFLVFGILNIHHRIKKSFSLPVFISVLTPGILNFYCLLFSPSIELTLLPILAVHGIAYFFLTGLTLKKTTKPGASPMQLGAIVLFIAIVFGAFERGSAELFVDYLDSRLYQGQWLQSLAASLIILPTLTHFALDGIIWRKQHPIFKQVFRS